MFEIDTDKLPKKFGKVVKLQVERTFTGASILITIIPDHTDEFDHYIIEYTGNDPVALAQLDLLRDAMQRDLKVRLMYVENQNADPKMQTKLVVAVRIEK